MASQDEILESNEAELILDSRTFTKAIAQLKEEYITLWLNSEPDDVRAREIFHAAVKLIPEVERHLRILVEKGKITKANLSRIRKIL